ncbi:MAG: DUF4290 domain-containing protein [Tannerella sp.]|jgi:hypothetical protein|nr:DUF4290 domain-containing protein [Tannerella sp.]
MKYNTTEKRLILPEYGRNIQQMVNHCLTIEDRDERNLCANSIISIMGNLFPHLRDVNDFKHILWDHLAIMSDFQLDVDYPYEIIKPDNLYSQPDKLDYSNNRIYYRHYGKLMEHTIRKATEMEDGYEKINLIWLIANFMKRLYITWNKDSVDDRKIFKDLEELSEGKIQIDEETYKLLDVKEIQLPRSQINSKKQNGRKNK